MTSNRRNHTSIPTIIIKYLHKHVSFLDDTLTSLARQGQDFVTHLPLQLQASATKFIPTKTYSLHACANI